MTTSVAAVAALIGLGLAWAPQGREPEPEPVPESIPETKPSLDEESSTSDPAVTTPDLPPRSRRRAGASSAKRRSRGTKPQPANLSDSTSPGRLEVEAVLTELQRGIEQLQLDNQAAPYRAEARLARADLLSLDGSYGGVVTNVQTRQAVGTVEIRVGDLTLDNSNFFGPDSGTAWFDLALTPSPSHTQKKIWLALDRAFRGASRSYAAKRNALEQLAVGVQPPDFSPAPSPRERLAKFETVTFDREGLAGMVGSLSARFKNWPGIDNGDVHVQIIATRETLITTEGLKLQRSSQRGVLAVVADTKAADGMHLDHGRVIHLQGPIAADGELLAQGEALVDRTLQELDAWAKAPMIDEEYDGPILLVGSAAAAFLGSTVATQATGTPPPLSDSGRMMDLEPGWQKRLGKGVLPPGVDLVDDPTLSGFGSYSIDAEGYTPAPLNLVRNGKLENLLMTRTPNAYTSGSNGRARMTPALEVGPAISNLFLSTRGRGLSSSGLERELLRRAREDGYEFAYIVEHFRDGSILGPVPRESAAAYAGTGKVTLPLPSRVIRLEPGGKRTLVRGAVLAPVSIRVLRRIRAVGNRVHVEPMRIPVGARGGFNADVGIDGVLSQTIDVQISTPDLLVDGLELLVERGEHERLPTLVHPLRRE